MKRWMLLFIPLTITGCSSTFNDPLYDAPIGQRVVCSSVQPLQGKDTFSTAPLNCPELNLSASLSELRDAGWRLESINLGEEIKTEETFATEVDVTVRKIY